MDATSSTGAPGGDADACTIEFAAMVLDMQHLYTTGVIGEPFTISCLGSGLDEPDARAGHTGASGSAAGQAPQECAADQDEDELVEEQVRRDTEVVKHKHLDLPRGREQGRVGQ